VACSFEMQWVSSGSGQRRTTAVNYDGDDMVVAPAAGGLLMPVLRHEQSQANAVSIAMALNMKSTSLNVKRSVTSMRTSRSRTTSEVRWVYTVQVQLSTTAAPTEHHGETNGQHCQAGVRTMTTWCDELHVRASMQGLGWFPWWSAALLGAAASPSPVQVKEL
jgi:hypothetical protein